MNEVWTKSTVLTVISRKNEPISDIESEWKELYRNSKESSPFLSWPWLNAVLNRKNSNYLVLIAKHRDKTVGLGILFFRNHGVKRVAYLNRTGVPALDQPWIEYNDFLLDRELEKESRLALIEHCYSEVKCDELVVGASLKATLAPFSLFFQEKRVEWYSQTYQIDLLRHKDKNKYLSSLSNNTRYQIQRASREYENFGSSQIEKAKTLGQAEEWLRNAAPHHIERWGDTRVGSGFQNPYFVTFHNELIRDCFNEGMIDLLTIRFGNKVIAYLYNFIVGKTVFFYLSANVYSKDIRYSKPGLVAHTLAIEYYLNNGFDTYDFMGGESQYKRSLATHGAPISIVRFQRKNILLRLESKARKLKRLLSKNPVPPGFQKKRVVITGGSLSKSKKAGKYTDAIVSVIDLSACGKFSLVSGLNFTPDIGQNNYAPETNIVYKSASLIENKLLVPTETEIKEIDISKMEVTQNYSLSCFNDLHHVTQHRDHLYIANTGVDTVTQLSLLDKSLTQHQVIENTVTRITDNYDYRRLPSTKPHIAHPNFCFVLNEELWVTRCDFMDAVSLSVPRKRIFIGDGLVHDGVVYGKHVYFTTVNGHIKAYDKKTTELHCDLNLRVIDESLNGWFRGICPISHGIVIIGMSKPRKSKRMPSRGNGSKLILVDIYRKKILQTWNIGKLGLDAVFSIIEVPKK